MPRFAANLGYLFTDRPLIERIDAAAACGFKAIELQFPYDVPAAAVKEAIDRHKLTVLGINTPPGDREGEFGLAALPGRSRDFEAAFARAFDYITAIGGSAVHCLAGKVAIEQRPAAERVYIEKVARPNLRMQFDFYHAQIVGGDLIYRMEQYLPVIGHLQCAAVPGRHEPDEGEVNYPAVFEAVDRLGYQGWIGAEYRPRRRTEDRLGWGRPYGITTPR